MPFVSRAQEKAAFGGYLGPEMKKKAKTWAAETPNPKSLPEHIKKKGKSKVSAPNPHEILAAKR